MYEDLKKLIQDTPDSQKNVVISKLALIALCDSSKALKVLYHECESSDGFDPNLEGSEHNAFLKAGNALENMDGIEILHIETGYATFVAEVHNNEEDFVDGMSLFNANNALVTSAHVIALQTALRFKIDEIINRESIVNLEINKLYYVRAGGGVQYFIPRRISPEGQVFAHFANKDGSYSGDERLVWPAHNLVKVKSKNSN